MAVIGKDRITQTFECGHVFVQLSLYDSAKIYDILNMRKKTEKFFSLKHKWNFEQTIGDRIGLDGKPAFINQLIDRVNNYYKKFVKSEGEIIKDIEGKLTDHKQR